MTYGTYLKYDFVSTSEHDVALKFHDVIDKAFFNNRTYAKILFPCYSGY